MLGKFEAVVDSINYNDTSRPSDLTQLCSEKAHCKFTAGLSEQSTMALEGAGGFSAWNMVPGVNKCMAVHFQEACKPTRSLTPNCNCVALADLSQFRTMPGCAQDVRHEQHLLVWKLVPNLKA